MPEYHNFDDFYSDLEKGLTENRPASQRVLQVFKAKAAKLGKPQLSDDEMMQAIGEDAQLSQGLKFTNAPAVAPPPPPTAAPQGPSGPGSSSGKLGSMGPGPEGTRGDGKSVAGILTTPASEMAFGPGVNLGTGVRSAIGERTSGPGRFLRELAGKAGDYLDFIQSPAGVATTGEAPLIAKVLMKHPKVAAALKIAASAPAVSGAMDTSPEGLANTAANTVVAGLAIKPPKALKDAVSGVSASGKVAEAGALDRVKQGLSSIGTALENHLAPTPPPPVAAAAVAAEEPLANAFYSAKPMPLSRRPVAFGDFYEPNPGLATIPTSIRRPTGATPSSGPHSMPGSPQGKVAAGSGIGQPLLDSPPAPDFRAGGAPQPSIAAPPVQGSLPPGRVAGAIEGGESGWASDPRANTRISAQSANELATKYKVDPSMLVDASGHSNEELVQTVNALHARKAQLSKMADGNKAEVSPSMIKELGRIADALGELVLKRDIHGTQAPPVK